MRENYYLWLHATHLFIYSYNLVAKGPKNTLYPPINLDINRFKRVSLFPIEFYSHDVGFYQLFEGTI